MLLGLAGVTGIGKSYYKDLIVEKLGFEKIKLVTTRKIREGEKHNDDKFFVTNDELQKLRDEDKIAYEFNMLGNIYAYTKDELFSNKNTVFEVHYKCIFDFKKICPNMHTIYLLPKNIEIAKDKTRQRHLDFDVENARLLEIDEHYNTFCNDEDLRNAFDYILYNDYNENSDEEILGLVRKMLKDK